MKYFYLLTAVRLLQSCVVYYNTDEIQNSMNNNVAQIEGNYSLAKDDFIEKNVLYNGLKSHVLDINDDSFKLLSEKKNSFDDAYQNLLDKKEALNITKNQFDELIEGKSKIKSNEKANFIIFDPNEQYLINKDLLQTSPTPFHGRPVQGKNYMSMMNGEIVFDNLDLL